jgi:putative FmdB family regulatory protein
VSAMLVDYGCRSCGQVAERWQERPVPAARTCPACGGSALRRFGGRLLGPAGSSRPGPADAPAGEIPGACALVPTAARALAARVRGDGRALDAEFARQERAIARGALNPAAGVVAGSPAHRAAAELPP